MHRSPGIGLTMLLATWLTTLSVLACGAPPEPDLPDTVFPLAQLVAAQQGQLSTDFISVPERIGLSQVGYGWWHDTEAPTGEASLQLVRPIGQIELFSADGDLTGIELEIKAGGQADREPRVQIRLNGERLDRLPAPHDWTRLEIPLPTDLVRRGPNTLELGQRSARSKSVSDSSSGLRLRRLQAHSASGRELWPARPQGIRVLDADPSATASGDQIEMPVAAYLDVVLTIPADAHLAGRYSFESQPRANHQPVYLYVQLLAGNGRELTLFHERLYRRLRRERQLHLDLSAWQGRQIRLRVGTTGSGNGVVHWQGLRLAAAEPFTELTSLPPIERVAPPRSGDLGRPDILVVLLDAARADGFSVFGGPYPTPATERLAADGTAFTGAISAAPWTGQSVPTILTGLFPESLGVGPWGSRLPDGVPTLAELLAGAGYRTVLWSQHPFYSNHASFRRGFQEFYRSPKGAYSALPDTDQLLSTDRPTFAFVHLIPPHAPYEPPPPFRGAYSGWYRGSMSVDAQHLNSYSRRRNPAELSAADRRYVFDRYLENAAFADHLVGRLLSTYDQASRYDDSLIVLLSDHGEAFLEHGRYLHTAEVHREMLHVPLVIKWPRAFAVSAERVTRPVSLVDLAATLTDGLGLDGAPAGFQGRSLLAVRTVVQPNGRPLYAMTRGLHDPERPPNTKLMLEDGDWRALIDVESESVRLYRSDTDPSEARDLAAREPLQALRLRQAALSQWYANRQLLQTDSQVEVFEVLDPEVEEQLRALGYLN